jgi:hypothetical protein
MNDIFQGFKVSFWHGNCLDWVVTCLMIMADILVFKTLLSVIKLFVERGVILRGYSHFSVQKYVWILLLIPVRPIGPNLMSDNSATLFLFTFQHFIRLQAEILQLVIHLFHTLRDSLDKGTFHISDFFEVQDFEFIIWWVGFFQGLGQTFEGFLAERAFYGAVVLKVLGLLGWCWRGLLEESYHLKTLKLVKGVDVLRVSYGGTTHIAEERHLAD